MGLLTREKEKKKRREGKRKRRKRERKKENTFTREKNLWEGKGGKRATFHWIVDRVTSVKEES